MLPVEFPEKNFTYIKPNSMTDEECGSLDVWRGDSQGTPIIISKWMPNKEDIEAINAGSGIWVSVVGQRMPPISLYTEIPFLYEKS